MPIKYKSTRGKQTGLSFEEVVLGGLATDGGLFVPESIPHMSQAEIESLRKLSYADLAYEIISKFISPEDIPAANLKDIVDRSFGSQWRHPECTPSIKLKDFWVLELFHGPTFAFKDVALQFLGNVFEFFLTRGAIQTNITILGATSGDTGSAAILGLRGKKNVNCIILYPLGKVTAIQERQMTTVADSNVHCVSVEGDFDDCQALVKAAFNDEAFRKDVQLGAINSINWARVLAQITYYFYSWLHITGDDSTQNSYTAKLKAAIGKPTLLHFAVPTGNFGDILAGYYAKRMGLPIDKLVVCTNENDVLHRFLETGSYRKDPATLTIAPSMDISVSSNFERYLLYLADEDTAKLAAWMAEFEGKGKMTVDPQLLERAQKDFVSFASSKQDIVLAMRNVFDQENYLLCPHTATAVVAVRALKLDAQRTCILATAHAAKFEQACTLALTGTRITPTRPAELDVLFSLPVRSTAMGNDQQAVQRFVRSKVAASKGDKSQSQGASASTGGGMAAVFGFGEGASGAHVWVTRLVLVGSVALAAYFRYGRHLRK